MANAVPILVAQIDLFDNDPRLLIHALSIWGERKVNSKGDVIKEEMINLAQTAFNGTFELLDKPFEGRPIREYATESGEALNFFPPHLRHRSAIATRTVGLKDNSPDAYARAITFLHQNDQVTWEFWDEEFFTMCQNLTKASRQMYTYRRNNDTNETPYDDKF